MITFRNGEMNCKFSFEKIVMLHTKLTKIQVLVFLPLPFLHFLNTSYLPVGSDGKESACNAGDPGLNPGLGRSPGEGMATHFSILAWRIPWTEEPGGL